MKRGTTCCLLPSNTTFTFSKMLINHNQPPHQFPEDEPRQTPHNQSKRHSLKKHKSTNDCQPLLLLLLVLLLITVQRWYLKVNFLLLAHCFSLVPRVFLFRLIKSPTVPPPRRVSGLISDAGRSRDLWGVFSLDFYLRGLSGLRPTEGANLREVVRGRRIAKKKKEKKEKPINY